MKETIKSDAVLRTEVIKLLLKHFGPINTEKFVTSIKDEEFDYTKWQRNLWENETIDEVHEKATAYCNNKYRE
ncbi:MAG: hypothetical protein LBC02_04730 [Planctomycetaceae bacterium]|jgi:hypothetical protein|nr:hypothetical protein [Planctomycetaceae bacterium]